VESKWKTTTLLLFLDSRLPKTEIYICARCFLWRQNNPEVNHSPVWKVKKKARKPWVTQEMLSKMDETRKWKNVNTEKGRKNYGRLRNVLKRATDNAKKNILRKYVMRLWNFKEQDIMIWCT